MIYRTGSDLGFAHAWTPFDASACGYVVKQRLATDLEYAIREAHAGRRFVSPPTTGCAVTAR